MALSIVYNPEDVTRQSAIDIVAVHGLAGDAVTTWTHPRSKKFWLKDFLPQQIPDARIMTFDYNAHDAFVMSTLGVRRQANRLLSGLAGRRQLREETRRPLVFIAHSLGGIVVKQALLQARLEAEYRLIKDATVGLIFLGTPHRGSPIAKYGTVLANVAQFAAPQPSDHLASALESSGDVFLRLSWDFRFRLPNYTVCSFFEQQPMMGRSDMVVERHSALLVVCHEEEIPVDADHNAMCRFEADDNDTFEIVCEKIRQIKRQIVPAGLDRLERQVNAEFGDRHRNWRRSVVDLLDLLGLNSSPDARAALSERLNVGSRLLGSATQNRTLQEAILRELSESNGEITKRLSPSTDDGNLESVLFLRSQASTAISTLTTLVGDALFTADEFVSLLLGDETMALSLAMALGCVNANNLETNFRRLLDLYSVDLQEEASHHIERKAVQLIRMRAIYIARSVTNFYYESTPDRAAGSEKLALKSLGVSPLLMNPLWGVTGVMVSGLTSMQFGVGEDYRHASYSGRWRDTARNHVERQDRDRVKAFMLQSRAYLKFRHNLREFVLTAITFKQQTSASTSSSKFCERITWKCGCGDDRYADVQEIRPGGASRLQAILRSSAIIGSTHDAAVTTSAPIQTPVPGLLADNSVARVDPSTTPLQDITHSINPVLSNNATSASAAASSSTQPDHKFLLLCLSINGSSTLQHLNIRDLENDQYLWNQIRDKYHELRRKTLWHQKIPITRWLSTISWLSWFVTSVDLTTANSVEFVRFQLVPIAMEIRPWNFHSPSLPPESEVKVKKTYHYHPCPVDVDPTGLNRELLHCLWKPGPHLDRFWLNIFPKKLKATLEYVSSKPDVNTGWGIRIVEGVNWAAVIFLGLILISCSTILGTIYSAVTHDVGGGFSMAAFLGTLPALGIIFLQLTPIV